MKFAFIFNPSADRERSTLRLNWLKKMVESRKMDAEIFVSSYPGHAVMLSKEAANSFDAIVACGGDGTIQEVARGMMDSSAYLGIVPLGSGNDFIKSAGISPKSEDAFLRLNESKTKSIDVIAYEADGVSGICINTLGLGFDGLINYEAKSIKNIKGSFVYTLAILNSLKKVTAIPFKIKSKTFSIEANLTLLTLANGGTEGGNFRIVPNADISDGLFDMVLIKQVSAFGILCRLGLFLIGQQHRSSKINVLQEDAVEIESEIGFAMHADGEHIGLEIKRVHARVLKSAIKLIV